MKDVIINGTEYPDKSRVQLTTTDGGTAMFRDEDEINGVESGTIVGSGTNTLEIPISSVKTHVLVWTPMQDAYAQSVAFINLSVNAHKGMGLYYEIVNASFAAAIGYAVDEADYVVDNGQGKKVSCDFDDPTKVTIINSAFNKAQIFSDKLAYNWIAW